MKFMKSCKALALLSAFVGGLSGQPTAAEGLNQILCSPDPIIVPDCLYELTTRVDEGIQWCGERGVHVTGIMRSRIASTRNLRMVFDHSKATSQSPDKPTFVLLHGILDRRFDLDEVTKTIDGFGYATLRPDWLGHGETALLNRDLLNSEQISPLAQIEMVAELINRLKLKKVIIIGHSMGGGLGMGLAQILAQSGVIVALDVPTNPYITPLDKFFYESTVNPEIARNFYLKTTKNIPPEKAEEVREEIRDKYPLTGVPWMDAGANFNFLWLSFIAANSWFNRHLSETVYARVLTNTMRSLSDPYAIPYLKKTFTKYERTKNSHYPAHLKMSNSQIALFVDGGIRATLGLRELDFLTNRQAINMRIKIPTLLLSGSLDKVVTQPQVEKFKELVKEHNWDITFQEMNSDHFLPQRYPDELIARILAFAKERDLF